ncbi:hypothetical protein NCS57_00491400 [Fusarium keratoplasticum]|uniref:Uncharacterized protein n=1 Tax=Fusarium keratoplasticum TaxID=1328300 RepID=A0ACC0R8J3_9HYPO|nr:hypothetical protein NCS57_00491400 [Fusarium keratoplasticum]KAI8664512.1 hypothetical protein NCS55_00960300 [Fusarium keratoplasticum]KAI8675887.1 hypothetical protein NCS57_00491400 [Fusarium keratoplasticum]
MNSDKNQTQLNQAVSEQTGSKPDNDKPYDRNQADGKRNDHQIPGTYAQVMSVAKLGLKNRRSGAELQRRRATILRELEKTRKLLAEVRRRLEVAPNFDEDDLSEHRQSLEARARDLEAKSTPSEAEEDKDHGYEDLIYEDCDYEGSGDDEDEGVPLGLEVLSESLHEDSCSSADDIEASEETNSNLNANSGEDSDSDTEINLAKGKGVKVDQSLNEECF